MIGAFVAVGVCALIAIVELHWPSDSGRRANRDVVTFQLVLRLVLWLAMRLGLSPFAITIGLCAIVLACIGGIAVTLSVVRSSAPGGMAMRRMEPLRPRPRDARDSQGAGVLRGPA